MTTKYNIGTLNEANLIANKGFKLVSDNISLKDCIDVAKKVNQSAKYVAISNRATVPAGNPLDMSGKCFSGVNYNPKIDQDDTLGNLFDIYSIPPNACTSVDDCLKINSINILDAELKEIEAERYDVQIRLYAIQHNLPYASAEQKLKALSNQEGLNSQLIQLNKRKEMLEDYKKSTSARNSETSILLSDKNRLLATVNSNIQQKYTKLENVNNKINTITQDIYKNNIEMKRKENIISTLKVIIIIVVLMAVVLIIYFAMGVIEEKYPNAVNNMINKYNNNKNIFY